MSNSIEKYELTTEQAKACEAIEQAFANAKKLGIRFLAKQASIHAYRKEALALAIPLDSYLPIGEVIPYSSLDNCIDDSGADDVEHFPLNFIDK
jgi:hypothetical protein